MLVSRCGSGVSGSAWGTPCPTTPSVTLARKLGSPSAVRSIRSSRTSAASAADRSAPELEAACREAESSSETSHGTGIGFCGVGTPQAGGWDISCARPSSTVGVRSGSGAPCGSFASTGMGPGGRLVTPTTTLEMPCATRSLRPPPATAPLAPADRGVPEASRGPPIASRAFVRLLMGPEVLASVRT